MSPLKKPMNVARLVGSNSLDSKVQGSIPVGSPSLVSHFHPPLASPIIGLRQCVKIKLCSFSSSVQSNTELCQFYYVFYMVLVAYCGTTTKPNTPYVRPPNQPFIPNYILTILFQITRCEIGLYKITNINYNRNKITSCI